jgi:hypothetical protein
MDSFDKGIIIIFMTLILAVALGVITYNHIEYRNTQTFIKAGYVQTQAIGNSGILWVKPDGCTQREK